MSRYLVVLASIFLLMGCSSTRVNIRVWQHSVSADTLRSFPERDDPELAYNKVKNTHPDSTFGIVFSGGGTRSATATLGQLRALDSLGWIGKAQYISAVSGGSWTFIPYTYLPANYSDKEFLGSYIKPGLLSAADITRSSDHYHGTNIADSDLIGRFVRGAVRLKGDETYSFSIGKIFLKPYGLDREDKFFTTNNDALQHILGRNANDLSTDDFYIIEKENRPYPIINATILNKVPFLTFKRKPNDIYPLEITPLYTGVPSRVAYYDYKSAQYYKGKGLKGGGYIETFGYDSIRPDTINYDGTTRVKLGRDRYRFTLANAIATTGAAPQKVLTGPFSYGLGLVSLGLGATVFVTDWHLSAKFLTGFTSIFTGLAATNLFGFPEYRHWPVHKTPRVKKQEYDHGDGGNIENIGLMPLLSRHVKKILVFVNTPTPFLTGSDKLIDQDVISDDLISFFRASYNHPSNKVFDEEKLVELYRAFEQKKIAGQPLVYCSEYSVQESAKFNIQPYDTDICWVYLDRTEGWIKEISGNKLLGESALSSITKRRILKRRMEFKNFPHYSTFFPRAPKTRYGGPIKLSRVQVNLMSNLTAWTVFKEQDYLQKNLFKD